MDERAVKVVSLLMSDPLVATNWHQISTFWCAVDRGSESCRTRSLRKFDASKNERSGDRSSREMDEAARDFPLIASSWPMISTNVALYIVIGSIFYVLLPWTVIICGKKKKFPEVTKSMMTTVKSVPTANPSVSGSQPIVPVKPATPDTAAGSAPNTSTDPVKKEEKDGKKETGSEEKKVEKKDEAGKDDVKSDKKVEGKKDADKEKSGKSKKPSGAEEGDGYEDCPDMTPEQLEKLCKDNDKQ
ncbi:hypothetical protein QR680_018526 [Steinernema hermaphroditum]|uniref:Uncharacterized protein n=1 Tax=Steinernema hermaphroditum TaxID=289476 RepID=A0AA39HKH5_9BILA|nr:hypothetical protein QR680_018526 [Steinernema hermaphroditum]